MSILSRTFHVTVFSLAAACTPMIVAAVPSAQSQSAQQQTQPQDSQQQAANSPSQTSSAQPDNSAQNKQQGKTADNQSSRKEAREMTANVRKALIADKSLSMYAHNVKIITTNGTVTLKGPVKSDEEKQKVVSDAAGVVSQDKIVDHLTVKQ